MEVVVKKPNYLKSQPFQPFKTTKPVDFSSKKWPDTNPNPKPHNSLTLEQKKAMNLCYKCGEKWFHGHKCSKSLHMLNVEEVEPDLLNEEEEEYMGEEPIVTLNSISNSNLRLLDCQGYDVILGVDWIASMGDITMNLGEGMMALKKDGNKIKLVNKGDATEIQMCE